MSGAAGSLRAVTRARSALDAARSALDAATAAYRRTLIDARVNGRTLEEIAVAAGITRQGVWKATRQGVWKATGADSRAQHTRPGTGGGRRA